MSDGEGTQSRAYDAVNRLTTVTRGSDSFSYAYDAAGNLVTTTLPAGNGYVETRTYDAAGRPTQIQNRKFATILSQFDLTFDPVGNPTQIMRNAADPVYYKYDASDRITEACFQVAQCISGSGEWVRWTYDTVGNRLSEQRSSGATTSSSYNAADQLTGSGYAFDANGNMTASPGRTYSYDEANRLIGTTGAGTTTAYRYDGDGNRVQASTGAAASQKTNFLWDLQQPLPQLALERDGTSTLLHSYRYGERPISMVTPTGTSYYHYGWLGNVANLTSASGDTEWTYDCEPSIMRASDPPPGYGALNESESALSATGPGSADSVSTTVVGNERNDPVSVTDVAAG